MRTLLFKPHQSCEYCSPGRRRQPLPHSASRVCLLGEITFASRPSIFRAGSALFYHHLSRTIQVLGPLCLLGMVRSSWDSPHSFHGVLFLQVTSGGTQCLAQRLQYCLAQPKNKLEKKIEHCINLEQVYKFCS